LIGEKVKTRIFSFVHKKASQGNNQGSSHLTSFKTLFSISSILLVLSCLGAAVMASDPASPASDPSVLYEDAVSLYENGDSDGAQSEFLQVIEMDPTFYPAYKGLGVIYYEKELYDEALSAFRSYLEYRGTDGEIWYMTGRLYLQQGNTTEGLDALKPPQNSCLKRLPLR
jgi:tetratricopeptide (TPR) repeat protein